MMPAGGAALAIALAFAFVNVAAGTRLQAYFGGSVAAGPLATFALLAIAAFAFMSAWRAVAARESLADAAVPFTLLAIATWAGIAIAVIAWYPDINACRLPYAGGNDRDDALDGAVRALLSGRLPYSLPYVNEACGHRLGPGGSHFSPMPGELWLAVPFVLLLGASAWQNLAWALAWLAVERSRLREPRLVAGLALLVLLAPQVLASELLTGGDVLAYTLQALVLSYLVATDKGPRWAARFAWPILLGVALSSRPHMAIVFVTLAALLHATHGAREAMVRIVLAALAYACVTLPIYLADPGRFDPLHVSEWIQMYAAILPHPRALMALAVAATLVLATRRGIRTFEGFCVATGATLVVPALFLTALDSIAAGALAVTRYAWYGVGGWILVASGLWKRAMEAYAR